MNTPLEISKERAIKDLQLEGSSSEMQNQIIATFFTSLEARLKAEIAGRMSEEQQEQFASASEEEQDKLMVEAAGGDMDAFVDEIYRDSVAEFHKLGN